MISIKSKAQSFEYVSNFRPIYYLGCKTSLTSIIKNAIDEVDPSQGKLLDLFSGTGAVSAALALDRQVTTVDVQEYSRVLCSAILNPSAFSSDFLENLIARVSNGEVSKNVHWCLQPIIEYEQECIRAAELGNFDILIEFIESPPLAVKEFKNSKVMSTNLDEIRNVVIERFNELRLWESPDTTVSRYFGGLYFSFAQAAMLDSILSTAHMYEGKYYDTLTAAALSTASQIVNTVGKQFAQPIQPRNKLGFVKQGLLKLIKRDRSLDALKIYLNWLKKYAKLPGGIERSESFCTDYLSAIRANQHDFSVVYADPPYTRDHYSRFYHVLETMCLRDNPVVTEVMKGGEKVASRGAYRENRYQSEFCIRSSAQAAFDALFKAVSERQLPLVLSYSPHETDDGTHPRVVSMSQLTELAYNYYDKVEVSTIEGFTHNKMNSSELKLKTRDHAEVLFKCYY